MQGRGCQQQLQCMALHPLQQYTCNSVLSACLPACLPARQGVSVSVNLLATKSATCGHHDAEGEEQHVDIKHSDQQLTDSYSPSAAHNDGSCALMCTANYSQSIFAFKEIIPSLCRNGLPTNTSDNQTYIIPRTALPNSKITAYLDGSLVWGSEPVLVSNPVL